MGKNGQPLEKRRKQNTISTRLFKWGETFTFPY